MADYKWFTEPVPEDLVVKQVYGIVFSNEGAKYGKTDTDKYVLF